MEKTLFIIVYTAFVLFFLFVLYSMIRNFRVCYQKNSKITNKALRVIVALLYSAFVGFFLLNGVNPYFETSTDSSTTKNID